MLARWSNCVIDRPLSRQQDIAALRCVPRTCYTNSGGSCCSLATRSRGAPSFHAAPPHTDARSAAGVNTTRQRRTARQPRTGTSGGAAPSEQDDGGSGDAAAAEDVEVFNLQTGWSVEALKEGLGAWNVVDARAGPDGDQATASDDLDEEDVDDGRTSWSTSNFAAFDDDEDGWSAEPVSDNVPDDEAVWSVTAEDDDSEDELDDLDDLDDDGVHVAKAAAERALLSTIPDHVMRELEQHAAEAKAEAEKLKPVNVRAAAKARRLHRRLRIISGSAAGRRLLSSQGDTTRPMMEMVRGAVFDILQGQLGCGSRLPDAGRWLDLFAGTGAVGIEGLSRGCREAHFVELDPRVARSVLEPNLEACDVTRAASVHVMKAEDFLRTAARLERFAGGAFDFISVCPPYELVDYNELYDLLDASPLVKETTMIVVEYPRRLANLVRDNVGPLTKIRNRKYGRTMVAIYGPPEDSGSLQW